MTMHVKSPSLASHQRWSIVGFVAMALTVTFMLAVASPGSAEGMTAAETGIGYYWWDATNGSKGQQVLVPLEVMAKGDRYEIRMLTGYLYSYFDDEGTKSHDMADVLDTKVNLSRRGKGPWGLRWLLGLDFNLPTGRTDLDDRDVTLIMDPDLVPITLLGEGFNFNPSFLLARAWGETLLGVGVGYLWRGEYDYSTEFQDYAPGDIWRATAQIRWRPRPVLTLQLIGGYTWYGRDELDDEDLYQAGKLWELGGSIRYEQPGWHILGSVRQYWRDEDRFRLPGSFSLRTEERNGYGDETHALAEFGYKVSEDTAVLLDAFWLHIAENDYPSQDLAFRGERQKVSVGLGLKRLLGPRWALHTRLAGFAMHDQETPEHPDDERSFRGWGLDVGIQARF